MSKPALMPPRKNNPSEPAPEQPQKPKKQEGFTMRIDTGLAKKIKFIANHQDKSVTEWVEDHIREAVEREYDQMIDELAKERKGK